MSGWSFEGGTGCFCLIESAFFYRSADPQGDTHGYVIRGRLRGVSVCVCGRGGGGGGSFEGGH